MSGGEVKARQRASKERRRVPRFVLDQDAFVVMRPHFDRIGKVRNIGPGGMCIEYVTSGASGPCRGEVDLFLGNGGFRITRIPCRVVYDHTVEKGELPNSYQIRRCGLAIEELSATQRQALEMLLRRHVAASA